MACVRIFTEQYFFLMSLVSIFGHTVVSQLKRPYLLKHPHSPLPQNPKPKSSLPTPDFPGQSNNLRPNPADPPHQGHPPQGGLKYRLRQDEGSFFGLLPMDPRTDRSAIAAPTTRRPYPYAKGHAKGQRRSEESQGHYEQEEVYAEDELSPDRNDSAECMCWFCIWFLGFIKYL